MSGYVRAVNFVKNLVKGGSKTSPTISSVKPNIPITKLEKTKSKLAILKQKTKGSKAKLNQTLFNIDQASKKAKEVAKDKRNEKIVKKFIGEEKADGGRIGRKMGGGSDMQNTNVKKKYKGFSKLPETVQIKINKKLAKKV